MKLTLVNVEDAKEGYEFVHMGPAEECNECRLAKTCMENVTPGRRYRVVAVKDKEHPCALHGTVKVVEVEETAVPAALDKRKAFIGSKVEFQKQDCRDIFCPNYKYCRPEGLFNNDVCTITMKGETLECKEGRDLVLVRLKRVP